MKVRVFNENIERDKNQIKVTLTASVCKNDSREVISLKPILTAGGVSLCSPVDEFNEQLGVRLAKCRAYKDLYEQVYCNYQTANENLKSRLRFSKACMRKYLYALEKQKTLIDELIDKSRPKRVTESISEISVRILPGSTAQMNYSKGIQRTLNEFNIPSEIISDGSLFSRIRKSDAAGIPFTLIIAEYEETNGVVSVHTQGNNDEVPSMPIELFINTYIKK